MGLPIASFSGGADLMELWALVAMGVDVMTKRLWGCGVDVGVVGKIPALLDSLYSFRD